MWLKGKMEPLSEKISIEGKSLRNKLTVIASLLFVLPASVVSYIMFNEQISMRSYSYPVMIGLTFVLAVAGLFILRKVFDGFLMVASFMKKADAGDLYMMEVQKNTSELHDISVSFNNLINKFEDTSRLLQEQTLELKNEVTKRKRAEEGLMLMVKAVENTKTGITFADRYNIIRYTNPAEAQMHGYTQQELLGQNVKIFAPPGASKPIAFEDMKAMKGWKRESVNVKKDGSLFPVYLISDVVENDEGEPIGIVTICEDTTEQEKVQKELEEAYAQVFHTSRLSQLGEMAMGIAREINLLLNSISRISQRVLSHAGEDMMPLLPPRVEKHLVEIDFQISRIKAIFEHLRTFADKETDSRNLHLIDVSEPISGALSMIEEQLKLMNISIEIDLARDLPKVLANPNWLEQVFLNIMTNARDAMESRSQEKKQSLTIRGWKNENGGATIDIIDTGDGVPEKIRNMIFEPFFTTKEVGQGTGLGLSISRSIITEHGGTLTLEPNEGEGSSFRITLPPVE